jgi:CheY-like chemotaxis protein
MPRLDGLEVLARIRADAQMAGVPTVMLTTSARDQDRAASLE